MTENAEPTSARTTNLLRKIAELSRQIKARRVEVNELLLSSEDASIREGAATAVILFDDICLALARALGDMDITPELPFERISEKSDDQLGRYTSCCPGMSAGFTRQQQLAGITIELAHLALLNAAGARIEMARSGYAAANQFVANAVA
jgi:hypothetical protein